MKQISVPAVQAIAGSKNRDKVAHRPETLAHTAIDFDGGLGSIIETFQEQTRYHRRTARRRAGIVKRFLYEPAMIAKAAKLRLAPLGARVIQLPEPNTKPTADFAQVLAKRRSDRRQDMSQAISLDQLSTLLHLAARVNKVGHSAAAPHITYGMRPYPSPGGLFPSELYVIAPHVIGLAAQTYRYDAGQHALIEVPGAGANFNAVDTAAGFEQPACILAITAVPERATQKYGTRGFRLALLEAGHLGQNLTLAAVALNLRSLVYGSFFDAELERMLGIDGCEEMISSSVLIGART